jgi:hypothetical protein
MGVSVWWGIADTKKPARGRRRAGSKIFNVGQQKTHQSPWRAQDALRAT